MRRQQNKIKRTNPTLPLKRDMSYAIVINQVGSQKYGGYDEGRNHERLADCDLSAPDCRVAASQQDTARPVQRCVESSLGKHLARPGLSLDEKRRPCSARNFIVDH